MTDIILNSDDGPQITLQPTAEVSITLDGGLRGQQGEQGIDGKSAYDVAVENGFEGTESEWLTSLIGDEGEDGSEIELQTSETHIQWRYIGDISWNNLIALSELTGDDGDAATITIGTVTTGAPGSDVEVENVGTSTDAILNISIPEGQPGEDGLVASIVAGTGITVDDTDPSNPIVSASASAPEWGEITGTLSSQTDLQTALNAKAASSHTHAQSDVTNLTSDLALKAPLASPTFTGTVTLPSGQILTAPVLGTPASGTLTNATGLPISTGVSGLGSNVATFLATPSSANLRAALTDEVGTGAAYFVGGALGTPASGTLTNATGLPVSGITASTSTALGVGSVELGHASDTTLSRSAAGVLAVEGVVIPSISSTNTLTNKRITKRTGTTTSSATPTINTDNVDYYSLTAQAADITSFTTNLSGTPTEGQTLWIAITGTAARAITWGSSFESSTATLPTTTVTTNRLDVGFVWNSVTSKWRCVAVA